MPLLLQARITSVSFEEARYRHYRAQQRREGALQKAAAQVRQRAPSPFDEDAAHATRRLFARTVAQVVDAAVRQTGASMDKGRTLVHNSKQLPPTSTLAQHNVVEGSLLTLILTPPVLAEDMPRRTLEEILEERTSVQGVSEGEERAYGANPIVRRTSEPKTLYARSSPSDTP